MVGAIVATHVEQTGFRTVTQSDDVDALGYCEQDVSKAVSYTHLNIRWPIWWKIRVN